MTLSGCDKYSKIRKIVSLVWIAGTSTSNNDDYYYTLRKEKRKQRQKKKKRRKNNNIYIYSLMFDTYNTKHSVVIALSFTSIDIYMYDREEKKNVYNLQTIDPLLP